MKKRNVHKKTSPKRPPSSRKQLEHKKPKALRKKKSIPKKGKSTITKATKQKPKKHLSRNILLKVHKHLPVKKKNKTKRVSKSKKPIVKKKQREYVKTAIPGFDKLFEKGIPKGASILLAGGAGAGKTLLGLQILKNAAKQGKKCLYMSFEEPVGRLIEHMEDFGWHPDQLIKKELLLIKRFSIFDIRRSLDALMAKSQGELLIDVKPLILPEGFNPDFIIVDSLTAIASAFAGHETYRSYIEHLFRYFESLKATSFLITETQQVPTVFSPTGVEEFLADGVIVLYNVRKGDIRESAIEVLKLRGANHVKKVVAMRIVSKTGIEVYPDQQVFSGIRE